MGRIARRVALACLLAAAGCGVQDVILGTQRGYLFTGYDVLAVPGEAVPVRARLQAGKLLRDQPGLEVRFLTGGQVYARDRTDAEGMAAVTFRPARAGDTVFRADLSTVEFGERPPDPVDILVACRRPDAPICIVDMDKTLVGSGFHRVLAGGASPMPDSVRVMDRLAGSHTVVYLTHRPEHFGPKSKRWLWDHEYPRGPVLLSSIEGFVKGSGDYKRDVILSLRRRFTRIEIGIGDKISDALAYHENGLRSFMIVQVEAGAEADELHELAADLGALPEDVQVVAGWDEIEEALFEGARFPRSTMQARLRALARRRAASTRRREDE